VSIPQTSLIPTRRDRFLILLTPATATEQSLVKEQEKAMNEQTGQQHMRLISDQQIWPNPAGPGTMTRLHSFEATTPAAETVFCNTVRVSTCGAADKGKGLQGQARMIAQHFDV